MHIVRAQSKHLPVVKAVKAVPPMKTCVFSTRKRISFIANCHRGDDSGHDADIDSDDDIAGDTSDVVDACRVIEVLNGRMATAGLFIGTFMEDFHGVSFRTQLAHEWPIVLAVYTAAWTLWVIPKMIGGGMQKSPRLDDELKLTRFAMGVVTLLIGMEYLPVQF